MKVVNFVLGLAAAIILAALIGLGIAAFYPAPVAPAYPNYPVVPTPICPPNPAMPCTVSQQQQAQQQQYDQMQNLYNQQEQAYTDAMSVYQRNLFIIANIIGIIVFAIGFWLVLAGALASNAVPVGIMIAGLWSIIYGYARGWGSVDDQLKFFIGLVIAVVVIGGSMWLMQRYQKNHSSRV